MAASSSVSSNAHGTTSVTRLPTLHDILADVAPPPWTLSALTAYLSQNHCLETLEFTMEAERYQAAYSRLLEQSEFDSRAHGSREHVCGLWQRLLHAYIRPYGPREVNLPAPVRDRLLGLPCAPDPPHPTELQGAVRIVYELMNDSVLVPFMQSVCPAPLDLAGRDVYASSRPRSGRSPKVAASRNESGRSPKTSFLPQLMIGRRAPEGVSRSASASSTDTMDRAAWSDDSGANSPPALEPMTPPTTPPVSDWAYGTSTDNAQPVATGQGSGWKKVGARLGLRRKSRAPPRSQTSSVGSGDSDMDGDITSNSNSHAWL